MGILRLCPGKTRRPGSSAGWERVVGVGPQITYLAPHWALRLIPYPKHSAPSLASPP